MKTGSFRTFRGPGRVSIARSARGHTNFKTFVALAPGAWFKSVPEAEYRKRYFDQLSKLDARNVLSELHALWPGTEPILMCWEVPPFTPSNWCHRRMVAEWFASELTIEVPELEVVGSGPGPGGGGGGPRPTRGQQSFDLSPQSDGSIQVRGSSGNTYSVRVRDDGRITCTCPAWRFSGSNRGCKHSFAVLEAMADLRKAG